jgi:asparagine synthase (glutamine-hydrolysing)
MCGIAGIFSDGGAPRDWLRENVSRMTDAIAHRGPDGCGVWIDERSGIALGHRRLAILDTSSRGSQPMASATARYLLVFNGEIYNFRELRRALPDYPYRSETDTEAILAAFDKWGIERTLPHLDGMFAIGVWDRRERSLTLARDRFGEKPLYYSEQNRVFLFASELPALRAFDGYESDVNWEICDDYLRRGYIAAPATIDREASKLRAAHFLRVGGRPQRFWSLPQPAEFSGSAEEAADELEQRLHDAVRSRLAADVTLGALLSGGVDSSAIVAMMNGGHTFTLGFTERELDESIAARDVARHLGTRHEELIATERDALAVVPLLPDMYGEPFADSSQIAAALVSKLARRSVTVALAGDGGDELFAGYPRYDQLKRVAQVPSPVRRWAAPLVAKLGQGEKMQMLADALPAQDLYHLYAAVMGGPAEPMGRDPLDFMARHDLAHYFADDLLVKLDRASMAASLEVRLPFLEPRLVAFALSLPAHIKGRKRVLRNVLARYIPRDLFERPKRGFSVPLAKWLCGPLRDWAEDLLPNATANLKPGDRCVGLWSRLMLEAWLKRRAATSAARLPESVVVPG